MNKKSFMRRKQFWIPAILILILISLRLSLPFWVKKYINKTLANIPNYYGQVSDIEISLIRGAYSIKGLYLNKVNAKTQVPFLNFEDTDISIQWKSLIKGKIVSEIEMTNPSIIYVFEDHNNTPKNEDAKTEDWSKALTNIVPIDINKLKITNGKVAFVEISTTPTIDLQLNTIDLQASNLRNIAREGKKLPSTLEATAVSIGNGKVILNGNMDIVKEIPDLDIAFSLEDAEITSLNSLSKHYAGIDFSSGSYGIFSEIAINDGYLKGYVKPILNNTKLIGEEDKFLETLWEGFVGFFKFVFKNKKEDTLATKVPFEGDLNNIKAGILPSIKNMIENGWIKAYKEVTDDSIEFEDAGL